jgi:hypothetical protein
MKKYQLYGNLNGWGKKGFSGLSGVKHSILYHKE